LSWGRDHRRQRYERWLNRPPIRLRRQQDVVPTRDASERLGAALAPPPPSDFLWANQTNAKEPLAKRPRIANNLNKNCSHLQKDSNSKPAPHFLGSIPAMIVCICHNVSDKAIRQAIASGAGSLHEVRSQLNLGSCCGKCLPCARTIVRESLEDTSRTITEVRREPVIA
jgi:bacterioferritin-associated ferredoxin